jgi:hypothetical protein
MSTSAEKFLGRRSLEGVILDAGCHGAVVAPRGEGPMHHEPVDVGIRAAAAALARIDASTAVSVEFATRQHHVVARRWLAKLSDQVIAYADAVSFAIMEATRCTVFVGFDADFVIAGFTAWSG